MRGNRRFLPHQSEAENRPQARVLHELQNPVLQKEKAPESGSLFFLELVTRLEHATC